MTTSHLTTLPHATDLLRAGGLDARVTAVRALAGGMISRVERWETDGDPPAVIAKLGMTADVAARLGGDDGGLRREAATLRWMRATVPEFPMPAVYDVLGDPPLLLLEVLPGRTLEEAHLTPRGRADVERQLAMHLGRLHAYRGEAYGGVADGEADTCWLDWFGPRLASNFADARAYLSPSACATIARLLADLPAWLPDPGPPTLIHGDLWTTNILVDDTNPDAPRLTGFIDGGGVFADVEYELAYLLVFNTAGADFFAAYPHPLRPDFPRRCRVYWLNTNLLHLWLFGSEYLPACERLAREIAALG